MPEEALVLIPIKSGILLWPRLPESGTQVMINVLMFLPKTAAFSQCSEQKVGQRSMSLPVGSYIFGGSGIDNYTVKLASVIPGGASSRIKRFRNRVVGFGSGSGSGSGFRFDNRGKACQLVYKGLIR